MYTISVGKMSEIADPDWLGNFGKAVTTLQFGAMQWGEWYEQAEHMQYEGAEVVGRQSEEQERYSISVCDFPVVSIIFRGLLSCSLCDKM